MTVLDDLQEILEAKSYGRYLAAKCIFHNDNVASLMVYEDYYRCLACGKEGYTQSLLRQLKDGHTRVLSYSSDDDRTKDYIPNPFSRWLKHNTLASVLIEAWETLNHFPAMGKYITEERQIDEHTRRKCGIGYKEDFYTFPIVSSNRKIIGAFARSRTGMARYFIPRGQDPNLIYEPCRRRNDDTKKTFLTFGGIDAISLNICGFRAISTTTGKRVDEASFGEFRRRITIIPDYGEEIEAYELASKLGWRGKVLQFPYPDGCKDINDTFRKDKQLITEVLGAV